MRVHAATEVVWQEKSRGMTAVRASALLLVLALAAAACSDASDPAPDSASANAPCGGNDGVGGAVPAGLGPGDLVEAQALGSEYGTTEGFPAGAGVWRILYVSTGADETDLQLVCGLVAAPQDGPKSESGRGRMLGWAHGTIGTAQRCQPSTDPARHFWGKTPGGIGAISWGSHLTLDFHEGTPENGILQAAIDRGWVIAATDYQPDDTYVVGRIAGANVLDALRAADRLMRREHGASAPTSYDFLTWGHSQGGHAALWAGQIAETYLEGTEPASEGSDMRLSGVALEAPASNFIEDPAIQPGVAFGDGLADSEMHEIIHLLPISNSHFEIQIGPALFSYVFSAWKRLSDGTVPSADASFPAFPSDAAPLELDAIATAEGRETIDTVASLCLEKGGDEAKILDATSAYANAEDHRMLVPSLWNLPPDYSQGEYFKGGLDRTCAETSDPAIQAWCKWLRWNNPGPVSENPYPGHPSWDAKPVPLLIAQGADDDVVHCFKASGTPNAEPPPPSSCTARALYDSLFTLAYCPGETSAGYLRMAVFRKIRLQSPAGHMSVPGQIASASQKKAAASLRFEGSPLDAFMQGAFDGTLTPGCSIEVVNADG